jgi:NAD(P)-dependent dehydrogenase (short-subunit alcohol dehydrogenase family)
MPDHVHDPLFDLTDKIALVTGGSRGLGAEMVRAFAARGAHVIIASRKIESCEAMAAEVTAAHGIDALPVACNVTRWDECERLVDVAYERFGRVDVLVNNAGASPIEPRPERVSEELFDKVLGLNFKGPFRLSANIGARMAAGDGGSIINVSSIASLRPGADVIPYAGAKAALNAMTEGFAKAYGPSVRVNCIVAGPFLTDISKAWDLDMFDEHVASRMALRRAGQPEDVVGAALYFASAASSYCTGALLRLDGGTP